MNSKSKSKRPTSIRVFGQRSIVSIFRSLPPNSSRDSEASVTNQVSGKSDESTHVSPSHFPDRKLQQSSLPPQTVPGKLTPFQCLRIPTGEQAGNVKQFEEEKNSAILDDKVIIEMFKRSKGEAKSDFVIPIDVDELENSVADDIQESRKGKPPFEGGNENQTVRSDVIVLEGESSLKPERWTENDSCIKKLGPCDSEASLRNQASQNRESVRFSLSHFLDRKLPKPSLPPQTVPGKLTPFQCLRIPTGEQAGNVKQFEEEKNGAILDDKVIIEMFTHTKEEGKSGFVIPIDVDELENSVADDVQESRKGKTPFEGGNKNQTVRNDVVVLGGESSLKLKRRMENDSCIKKPRPCDSEAIVRNQASQNSESTCALLSHFLDSKLPKSSLPPQVVSAGNVKQVEEEKNGAPVYDKLIIEMFKRTKDEGQSDFVIPLGVDELENSVTNDIQELRKRNPFEGGNENQTVRNHVVILGGGSSLKPKRQMENSSGNKKPRPLYNHYKNGRGWWDYDMEGVDNEQLGSSEVWEGVGSTTLGGIADWH